MKRRKILLSLGLCLVLLLTFSSSAFAAGIVGDEVETTGATGIVTGSNVNLRSGPGLNYSSVEYDELLAKYDTFNVIGFTYNGSGELWYSVEMTSGNLSGRVGYIRSDMVYIYNGSEAIDFPSA